MGYQNIVERACSVIAEMNDIELRSFIVDMVMEHFQGAPVVMACINREYSMRPYSHGLRRILSFKLPDAPKPDKSGSEASWMVSMFGGISDDDLVGMDDFRKEVVDAVEFAISHSLENGLVFDAATVVKRTMSILSSADNRKVNALEASMEMDYFPEALKRVYDGVDNSTKDDITKWAMEHVDPMPDMYDYQTCAEQFIYNHLDDKRHYRVMRNVLLKRLERFRKSAREDGDEPYFDSWVFEEVCRCMTEIRDWKGIERITSEYADKVEVHMALGKMYSRRRMYDKALEEYIAYYDGEKDVREREKIVQKLCNEEKYYAGSSAFTAFLERVIFEDDIDLLSPSGCLYRNAADDEKPQLKARLMDRCEWDELKEARVFGTCRDIVAIYRSDFFSDCEDDIVLDNLYSDYRHFAGRKSNVGLFAQIFEQCLKNHSTPFYGGENNRNRMIVKGFRILSTSMKEYGLEKARKLYQAFKDEYDLEYLLEDEHWFGSLASE